MLTESWPEANLGVSSKDTEPQVKVSGRLVAPGEYKNLRQQALSSAIFYSECTLNRIPQGGATNAVDIARSHLSKWWLPGQDPCHPSLQLRPSTPDDGCGASPPCKPVNDFITASDSDAIKENTAVPHRASTNLGEEDDDIPDDDLQITAGENGANAPLFARDDDLGTIASLHFLHKPNSSTNSAQGHESTLKERKPKATSFSNPNYTGKQLQSMFGATEDVTRSHYICSSIHGSPRKQKRSKPNHDFSTPAPNSSRIDRGNHIAILGEAPFRLSPNGEVNVATKIKAAKTKLLSSLEVDGAGIEHPECSNALATLEKLYQSQMSSTSEGPSSKKKVKTGLSGIEQRTSIDGTWMMISPPSYPSCLGVNENGERMFTLGRMTFDMFHPADLICTIQQQLNIIKTVRKDETLPIYIPPSLRQEVENEHNKDCCGNLKTHNIIASFTIEKPPHLTNNSGQKKQRKLRGILTNYGYTLPDPHNPNRNSIWFTSGTIEPVDEESLDDWKACFGEEDSCVSSRTQYTEKARSLASTILLGAVSEPMDRDGTKGYYLKRPIGGHGYAYCDIIYMDEDIRVMRGHSGSVFVFRRIELND